MPKTLLLWAEIFADFYNCVSVRNSGFEYINVTEFDSGCIISFNTSKENPVNIGLPQSSNWNDDEVRFMASREPLNEYGLIYVTLFMAANYARYYPEQWLVEIEKASPLALAIEELLTYSEKQVPLFALSEMSRKYHVVRS